MHRATRRLAPALALALALGAAACNKSDAPTTTGTTAASGNGGSAPTEVTIEVSESGCTPASVQVQAGTVKVTAKNTGGGIGELEVMTKDKKVKGEVENIAPGMSSTFNSQLEAGEYDLICFGDESPKGSLTAR